MGRVRSERTRTMCLSTLQTVRVESASWIEEKTLWAAGSVGYHSFLTSPSELYTCMASTETHKLSAKCYPRSWRTPVIKFRVTGFWVRAFVTISNIKTTHHTSQSQKRHDLACRTLQYIRSGRLIFPTWAVVVKRPGVPTAYNGNHRTF